MANEVRNALAEGLVDAAAFVGGALGGWGLGRLLGFDAMAGAGWDSRSMVGLVFILAGCGVGQYAARRWKTLRRKS